jgi:ferric-dicitrate binding protein FerR (iron transport regulator)
MEDFKKMDMEEKIAFVTARYTIPGGLSNQEVFGKLMERIEHKEIPSPKATRSRSRILYYTAAASLVLIITLFFTFRDFQQSKIVAGTGEQRVVELPDGSGVFLNAMSEIRYSEKYFQKNRLIRLNGEAYFEVKEGSLFTVESDHGKIEVLGTSFNVQCSNDYFKVSCLTGRVVVTAASETDTISRGESVSWISNEYRKTREQDIIKNLSWREGEFYYESTELRFVLDEIERQFGVSIKSSGIENRRFTGSFYGESLEEALQIVCIPMDLDFKILEQGKVHISP